MRRPVGLTVVALLALVQTVMGSVRAVFWFELGDDMMAQGLLVTSVAGMLMMARAGIVALVVLLYATFSIGALARQGWAWWVGVLAAVLNLGILLPIWLTGEDLIPALTLTVIPLVLVCYLMAPAGRQALTPPSVAMT
jgi:hypothetical protein